jgi:hypothetical protein
MKATGWQQYSVGGFPRGRATNLNGKCEQSTRRCRRSQSAAAGIGFGIPRKAAISMTNAHSEIALFVYQKVSF